MRRQNLAEGNKVLVKLGSCRHEFEATITGFEDGWIRILPIPKWPTWRRVRLSDIAERLDPPMRRRHRRTAA